MRDLQNLAGECGAAFLLSFLSRHVSLVRNGCELSWVLAVSTYEQCNAQGYLEGNVENSLHEEIGLDDEDVYLAWISAFCGIQGKSRAASVSLELHCSLNPCLLLELNKPQRTPESPCLGLGV